MIEWSQLSCSEKREEREHILLFIEWTGRRVTYYKFSSLSRSSDPFLHSLIVDGYFDSEILDISCPSSSLGSLSSLQSHTSSRVEQSCHRRCSNHWSDLFVDDLSLDVVFLSVHRCLATSTDLLWLLEVHRLGFVHDRWVSSHRRRLLVHHFSLVALLTYSLLFYVVVIFFPPCQNFYFNVVMICVISCYTRF